MRVTHLHRQPFLGHTYNAQHRGDDEASWLCSKDPARRHAQALLLVVVVHREDHPFCILAGMMPSRCGRINPHFLITLGPLLIFSCWVQRCFGMPVALGNNFVFGFRNLLHNRLNGFSLRTHPVIGCGTRNGIMPCILCWGKRDGKISSAVHEVMREMNGLDNV